MLGVGEDDHGASLMPAYHSIVVTREGERRHLKKTPITGQDPFSTSLHPGFNRPDHNTHTTIGHSSSGNQYLQASTLGFVCF